MLPGLSRIAEDNKLLGTIEARLIPASPNCSIVLIDPGKVDGKIFVELVGYRSALHKRPHIELTRYQDKY
jgi:hypothetical protein